MQNACNIMCDMWCECTVPYSCISGNPGIALVPHAPQGFENTLHIHSPVFLWHIIYISNHIILTAALPMTHIFICALCGLYGWKRNSATCLFECYSVEWTLPSQYTEFAYPEIAGELIELHILLHDMTQDPGTLQLNILQLYWIRSL